MNLELAATYSVMVHILMDDLFFFIVYVLFMLRRAN